MSETRKTRRTITLTGRPPVKIVEDDWPELAEASYYDYEGQYDFQSFRYWRGFVRVRQHSDGRAIIYARCWYDTAYQAERGYSQHSGEMLPSGCTTEDIISAIQRVHGLIDIVDEEHRDQWRLLADECIADLPAQEL